MSLLIVVTLLLLSNLFPLQSNWSSDSAQTSHFLACGPGKSDSSYADGLRNCLSSSRHCQIVFRYSSDSTDYFVVTSINELVELFMINRLRCSTYTCYREASELVIGAVLNDNLLFDIDSLSAERFFSYRTRVSVKDVIALDLDTSASRLLDVDCRIKRGVVIKRAQYVWLVLNAQIHRFLFVASHSPPFLEGYKASDIK